MPLAFAMVLAGCGGDDAVRRDARAPVVAKRAWPVVTPDDPARANAVLMRALGLVGTPYRYGGNSPEGGFDCSGLVHFVFRDAADVRLPRTSRDLNAMQGPCIAPDRLGEVSPRFGTPTLAIWLSTAGSIVFMWFIAFQAIALLTLIEALTVVWGTAMVAAINAINSRDSIVSYYLTGCRTE